MAYTDKLSIENYLLTTIDSSFSTQVTSWISAAQRWIDNYTDRTFEATTLTKKFDGNNDDDLNVQDLLSVDTIWFTANDSTSDAGTRTLSTTDYYLYRNDDPNPVNQPYNRIELNRYGGYATFPYGQQNIWIKGSWGYSTTAPADIQMVATKLVASIINVGKDGNVKSFSEGDYQVTFGNLLNSDLQIKQVLNFYKRPAQMGGFNISRS